MRVLSLFIILLSIVSCNRKSYEEIIPSDAKAVVVFNLPEMAKKAGIGPESGMEKLSKILSMDLSGLDLSEPLYGFVTANEYLGLVASVNDEDKVMEAIERLCKQGNSKLPEDRDGLYWADLYGKWQVAWNSSTFLVLGPGVGAEQGIVRKTMKDLFDADSEESFVTTKRYKQFAETDGDVVMYSSLDAVPTPYNTFFRVGMPEKVEMGDVQLFSSVFFETGKIKIQSVLSSEKPSVMEAYEVMAKEHNVIKGSFTEMVPSGAFAWLGANVKGENFLNMLRKDGTMRTLLLGLNTGIDADMMIRSISGDVALAITGISKDAIPRFSLLAEIGNSDFLNDIPYWKTSIKGKKDIRLKDVPGGYCLSSSGKDLFFGVKDKKLFAASTASLAADAMQYQPVSPLTPYVETLKGSSYFMWVDVRKLLKEADMQSSGGSSIIKGIAGNVKTVLFVAKDPLHAIIEIETNTKNNVLKDLMNE